MLLQSRYHFNKFVISLIVGASLGSVYGVQAKEVCCNAPESSKQDSLLFHVTDSSFSDWSQARYPSNASLRSNYSPLESRVNSVQEEALSKFKLLKQDIRVHDHIDNSQSSILIDNTPDKMCRPCTLQKPAGACSGALAAKSGSSESKEDKDKTIGASNSSDTFSSLVGVAAQGALVAHSDNALGSRMSQRGAQSSAELGIMGAPVGSSSSQGPAPFANIKLLAAPYLENESLTAQAYGSVEHLKGQPINAATLQNMLDSLSTYYQEQGFILSKAYLPLQNIEGGLVQVLVANPKFNHFTLENNSLVRASYLEYLMSGIYELEGQEVSADVLDNKMRKLADLGTFSLLGEASNADPHGFYKDIDFLATPTDERFSFALFADNQGNKSAGRYRFGGLMEIQNPTGSADRLQFSYARSNEQQNNYSLSYRVPINSHPTVWGVDVCYSDYELAGIYRQLGAQGKSLSVESYLLEPVVRTANAMFNVQAGVRYRKLTDEYANFDLKFEKHTWSGYVGTSGFYHQDNWIFNYDTKAYATRIYCDDEYDALEERTYFTLEGVMGLGYRINQDFLARTSLRYQLASDYVDGADSFLAGGDTGLRAYEFGDISGDGGVIWKNELTYYPDFIENAALSAHIETAKVYNHDYKGEKAYSAGITLNYQFKGLNAEIDFSHGLGTMPIFAQDDSSIKFNCSYSF